MRIRSKHGKDILENKKQYNAANGTAEKVDYKTYRNRIIEPGNGKRSDCGNNFCRKRNLKYYGFM